MTHEIICAGFGVQGILFLGKTLAYAGLEEKKEVSWIPSYGPEMRGGTCNCSVVVSSDKRVGMPVVTTPNIVIAMNRLSMERFEPTIVPNGYLIYNTTLIEIEPQRKDIKTAHIAASQIANELGNVKLANIVMLGALLKFVPIVERSTVEQIIREQLTGSKAKFFEPNMKAINAGEKAVVIISRSPPY